MRPTGYGSALIILLGSVIVSGCAAYAGGEIIRPPRADRNLHRIEADIDRYLLHVDRSVRLDSRQHREITRLLRDRTYRLLDRSRTPDHRYVYPYPRRSFRAMNRTQRTFWRDVDRRIERYLSRAQARRYAYITGERRSGRASRDRYERRDDRRYEPRGRSRFDESYRRGYGPGHGSVPKR